MITLKDYFMGRDVTYRDELTPEITANATRLLSAVNDLLWDLNSLSTTPVPYPKVNSGWRPAALNASIGGAQRSYHCLGLAIDLADDDEATLDALILKNFELLTKYQLWQEYPKDTPGWVHLDLGDRPDRPIRVFNP